jgi:hypothetical protein
MRDIHLVGSVPLESAEAVFRTAVGTLGERLRRIPDGETGDRSTWIRWQSPVFAAHPQFEQEGRRFRLSSPAPEFDNLGYADAALASYETFAALKAAGVLPAGIRFQVSLPTAVAVTCSFVVEADQGEVEPRYAAALGREVDRIAAAVPATELAIQWDIAVEMALLEGVRSAAVDTSEDALVRRIVRLVGAVPADVPTGFHLCYGDFDHQHFVQPADTGLLVRVANRLVALLDRPPAWVHMPVPRDRDDHAYFRPLAELTLPAETEFYLGLVHASDGIEGAGRRIAAARDVRPDFGVGTECGFGRRDPATIPGLFDLHRAVADMT